MNWRAGATGATPAPNGSAHGPPASTLARARTWSPCRGNAGAGNRGSYSSITRLSEMADQGEAWPLADGRGNVLGNFVIERLEERHSSLIDTGQARVVGFTIELSRVTDRRRKPILHPAPRGVEGDARRAGPDPALRPAPDRPAPDRAARRGRRPAGDRGFQFGREAGPAPEGARLTVQLGWDRGTGVAVGLVNKGSFLVDEVGWQGPPDVVTIRAHSADFADTFRKRRTRTWKDKTLGAMLQEVAGAHGLTAKVHGDLAGKQVTAAEQHNKSDMEFLRDLGRRYDAIATVKDGKLLFAPIDADTTASGQQLPSLTLTRSKGDRYRYERAARDRPARRPIGTIWPKPSASG